MSQLAARSRSLEEVGNVHKVTNYYWKGSSWILGDRQYHSPVRSMRDRDYKLHKAACRRGPNLANGCRRKKVNKGTRVAVATPDGNDQEEGGEEKYYCWLEMIFILSFLLVSLIRYVTLSDIDEVSFG